jgi:hypothetical protein
MKVRYEESKDWTQHIGNGHMDPFNFNIEPSREERC